MKRNTKEKKESFRIHDFIMMLIYGFACICFCYLWYVGELDFGLPIKIIWLLVGGGRAIRSGIDAFKKR